MIKRRIDHGYLLYLMVAVLATALTFSACGEDDSEEPTPGTDPTETDFTDLLSNQVNEIIIPSMEKYQEEMTDFVAAVAGFASSRDEASLVTLRSAHRAAYLAYQAAAVHNFYSTSNQALVETTNLYPVDVTLLENLIASESYNFSTEAQERANGFPAIDYLLYGPADVLAYFGEDAKRLAFLQALVNSMKDKADTLVSLWTGNLANNFVENGGTALGSSISVQLNESLVYYEEHIRGNKVGIPIGLNGPNDSPIDPDATKIEAYYQSLVEGNENLALALLRASIEEVEDFYLGTGADGTDGQGYDDLLLARDQAAVDTDIKAQFEAIYSQIGDRNSISGDNSLYNSIQTIVTLFKSDLFPLLDVQDADGKTDGD